MHQDLKTANVLLDHRGGDTSESFAPRITDFGLSFRVEEPLDSHGRLVGGTPAYMAPEQRDGRIESIGPATDVYALGIVLRQLIGLSQAVRDGRPAPVDLCPPDLSAIIDCCSHDEPEQRYRNGWDLRDDLRRFLLGDPVRARPLSARESIARWIRRRPVLAGLAATLFVTVILSILGLTSLLGRERHLRQVADRRQQEAEDSCRYNADQIRPSIDDNGRETD